MKTEYHEAIGEDLDTGVAEGGGSELEVTEVTGEDLSGHGHDVVDQVNDDGGSGEVEQELALDPRGQPETAVERDAGVGEYHFKFAVGFLLPRRKLIIVGRRN